MNLSKGIICGLDAKQEYLLPFFFLNLRLFTDLPIVFFDYGMSMFGKQFCEKRGLVIPLDETLHHPKTDNPLDIKRKFWFKKPLACLASPFDISLWIDMDCMARGPVDEIFSFLKPHDWICISKEFEIDVEKFQTPVSSIPIYNSGVFVFPKNSPILDKWVENCIKSDRTYVGDQDLLSFELFSYQDRISYLDPKYNTFVASNPIENTYNFDLEQPLNLVQGSDRIIRDPQDVFVLHFAGNAKSLFLARHQFIEQMCAAGIQDASLFQEF